MYGGLNPSEHMKVSWDDHSQTMEKWRMFQTSNQIESEYPISYLNLEKLKDWK